MKRFDNIDKTKQFNRPEKQYFTYKIVRLHSGINVNFTKQYLLSIQINFLNERKKEIIYYNDSMHCNDRMMRRKFYKKKCRKIFNIKC